MKQKFFLLLLLWLPLLNACTGKRIPRDDMHLILRDMYMIDMLIEDTPEINKLADSTWVYPQIYDKYGYNTDEFIFTINYYMGRPDRFRSLLNQIKREMLEERNTLNMQFNLERELRNKYQKYLAWLDDSLSTTQFNYATKLRMKQLLTPDSTQIPVWNMDCEIFTLDSNRHFAFVRDTLYVSYLWDITRADSTTFGYVDTLPAHFSRRAIWKRDSIMVDTLLHTSTFVPRPLRTLSIIDTLPRNDSIPAFLTPAKTVRKKPEPSEIFQ